MLSKLTFSIEFLGATMQEKEKNYRSKATVAYITQDVINLMENEENWLQISSIIKRASIMLHLKTNQCFRTFYVLHRGFYLFIYFLSTVNFQNLYKLSYLSEGKGPFSQNFIESDDGDCSTMGQLIFI